MLDTLEVAPDITTADLQKWVDTFYREIAFGIINDSADLPEDWNTIIKPQFRKFFFSQEEVKEKMWLYAFGGDERDNQKKIVEVEKLYQQAEKMLYAKVKAHLDFTEKGVIRIILTIGSKIGGLLSSFSWKRGEIGSTYEEDGFLVHTDNTPVVIASKRDKPEDYDAWDRSLLS